MKTVAEDLLQIAIWSPCSKNRFCTALQQHITVHLIPTYLPSSPLSGRTNHLPFHPQESFGFAHYASPVRHLFHAVDVTRSHLSGKMRCLVQSGGS
jgi:hypothetical protein